MLLDWLGQGMVVLTVVGSLILCLVIVAMANLLRRHLALRPQGLAMEARWLARPLPPDDALPHVVVQIPVFNEGAIVERAVASAARLDWPIDKLHIQICDDSDDATTELARAAAQRAGAAGIDIAVVRRPDRSEFKAGNLKHAMAQTGHDYFAIFDVDFVPAPDFLRRCMAVLLAEPGFGFVQARIDFLNANENALTRAQAIMLDYHYGFDLATRSWAQQVVHFNGSGGIWRRAAIEAAGGWSGDTLLEDWDLSFRAWLKGWRGVVITSVTAAGELPAGLGALMLQRRRWAAGGTQVAWKMLPLLAGNRTSLAQHWNGLLHLASSFAHSGFAATLIVAIAAMVLRPSSALMLGAMLYAVLAGASVLLFAGAIVTYRIVRRRTSWTRFVLDFPLVLMLNLYTSWAILQSLPGALLGRSHIFERTPKRGTIPSPR